MNNLLYVLLQCAPPADGKGSGGAGTIQLVFLAGIILVFWLFMIRPQAKKAKAQQQFSSNLQKGDRIVTIAGIHGTVNKVNEDGTLNLEVSPGMYIKIEKSSISMEWTNQINKQTAAK
jgi:preprotein translocase subunit YajC